MKRILFMTVGTAIGEDADKKIESLAHGLLVCIEHYKPDHIVFFGSEDSRKTIKEIERQHKSQYNKELSSYEFIQFTSIDDFDSCFQLIQNEIYKYSNSEIIIDYTSGTKTMTMSAAIAAVLFHKKLTLISGRRKDGVVLSGTERIVEQSLYSVYDKLLLRRMKESFNNYRYNAARNYLDEIVLLNGDKTKKYYYNLIDSFSLWDRFNHKEAFDKMKQLGKECSFNKEFLCDLLHKSDKKIEKDLYFLADLLNNAKRRLKEEKFDDAMARLYRAVELMAQYRLKSAYNLPPHDISLEQLEKLGVSSQRISYFKERKSNGSKVKLGLYDCYLVLDDLNDDLGKMFSSSNKMKDLLKERNESILAHGLKPVKKEKVEELLDIIIECIDTIFKKGKKFMKLMELSKFPKLMVD